MNKQGSGIALLIKKCFKPNSREDLAHEFEEGIWCDVISNSTKTLTGICYHSPSINIIDNEKLNLIMKKVSKENLVLMGDFHFGSCID